MTVTSWQMHNFHFKRFYGNENSCALKMGCCCSSPGGNDEREALLQSNSRTQTESVRQSRPAANGTDQKSGRFTAQHVGVNDLDERFNDGAETFNKQQEHYKTKTQIESARQSRPAANDQKSGRFTARHVGVNDLDERFNDVAETFNKQQEHYEIMKNMLQAVADRYKCPTNDSLTQCLNKVKQEYENCYIRLEVKGYDFTLMVTPEAKIPSGLKMTKDNITELSKAAKAIMSVATKLQEMIDWLLKMEDSMIKQVESTENNNQDKKRLLDNLKENLREARRAKETSPRYRKEAGNLLNEATVLSGNTP